VPRSAVQDKRIRTQVFKAIGGDGSVTSELNYNSLHDKHLQEHFYKKSSVRDHLIRQGIVTDDWRVVGTTDDFFKGMKAHRLLMARNQKRAKMEAKQNERVQRIAHAADLPPIFNQFDARAHRRKLALTERKRTRELDGKQSREALRAAQKLRRQAEDEITRKAEERAAIEHRLEAREQQIRSLIPSTPERKLSASAMRDLPPLADGDQRSSLLLPALDRQRADTLKKETEKRLAARAERIKANQERMAIEKVARDQAKADAEARAEVEAREAVQQEHDAKDRATAAAARALLPPTPPKPKTKAELKQETLLAEAEVWEEQADIVLDPLREMGWQDDWLELAALDLIRTIDGGRSGWVTSDELLLVLNSPSLGLNLSSSAVAELTVMAMATTSTDSGALGRISQLRSSMKMATLESGVKLVQYLPLFKQLATLLKSHALSAKGVFEDQWCTIYDGCTQMELRYNKATRETRISPPASVMEAAEAQSTSHHGALGRAVLRVLHQAGRNVWCAFSTANLHSRITLVPTPARFNKRTCL
jgi:hypothetical protein